MSLTVRIEGLAALDKALGELPRAAARTVLRRTITKAAQPMLAAAKANAPVKTGKLRDSIAASVRVKNKAGNAEYSAALRAGLGKGAAVQAMRDARREAKSQNSFVQLFIGPSGKAVPYAHILEFGSVDTPMQPYMRPAWDSTKGRALDIIKAELGNEIIAAARRLGRSKKATADIKYRASVAALLAHEAGG